MKLISLLILLLIFTSNSINAQLNQGGKPLSFGLEKQAVLKNAPFEVMEEVDEAALRAEDRVFDTIPDVPFRFGFNHYVNLNPDNSGVWDEIKDGHRIWRLGIRSKGALTINLAFDKYRLPEGAELFVYNEDRTHVIGAFTHKNNQDDMQFATTLVNGDAIIIEYFEPEDVNYEGELNLWRVTHGYRSVGEYADKDFGGSGWCNLNVACPEADGWEEQINSVAMLVTDGSGFCTGTLLNNAENDETPYFLSADHCYNDPGSVVFWFNWQSETCANPDSSPDYDALSGAVQRARNSDSDFWLMELNQTPPEEYNVFYSGWNRTMDDEITGTVVGIHHPSADIKKFSWADGGVYTTGYLDDSPGSGTTHWRVGPWSGETTTEPGSSGSALFDPDGRLIGQLHGGYAACGNNDPDWYGKFGTSWTGGGTDATRLSNWLDPNNTGAVTVDGYDPSIGQFDTDGQLYSINIPESQYFEIQDITPEVVIRNAGQNDINQATVSYTINGGDPVSVNWSGTLETGETDVVVFPEILIEWGTFLFEATISVAGDENPDNDSMSKEFSVVQAASNTYTEGDISTDGSFTELPGDSDCPGTLVVTIPDGADITGVDVEYEMTALPDTPDGYDAWMSEQRSQLRCVSPGGTDEETLASGAGNSAGTYSYSRTNLDIANNVEGGGDIEFEIHAGRTWGGEGCNTNYNKVDDGTWTVTVYYDLEEGQLIGDLNGDGVINVLDVVLLVNFILDNEPYDEIADVNEDGVVDVDDLVALVNIILEISKSTSETQSQTAYIGVDNKNISFESDGTVAAILFEIEAENADRLKPVLTNDELELAYKEDDKVLRVLVYSFDNTPLPEITESLLVLEEKPLKLTWGELSASNVSAGSVELSIKSTTDVSEQMQKESNVKVYPNPNKGHFNLSMTLQEDAIVNITIQDIMGRVIKRMPPNNFTSGDHELEINFPENFTNGFYILRMEAVNSENKTPIIREEVKILVE